MSAKENSNVCSICGREFALKSSLKLHMVKHRNKNAIFDASPVRNKNAIFDASPVKSTHVVVKRPPKNEANTCAEENAINDLVKQKKIRKLSTENGKKVTKPIESIKSFKETKRNDLAKVNKDSKFVIKCEEEDLDTEKELAVLADAFLVKSEEVEVISEDDADELINESESGYCENGNVAGDFTIENEVGYCENENDTSFDEFQDTFEEEIPNQSDYQYECGVCGKELDNVPSLTRHMHTHTVKTSRKCLLCPKTFAKRNGLEVHMARHSLRESQQCKICKKHFGYLDSYKKHEAIIQKKTYQCMICMEVFCSKGRLHMHKPQCKLDKENDRKARLVCNVCKTGFASEDLLQEHKQMKSFACSICQVCFKLCRDLKNHQFSHDLGCRKCGITFKGKNELTEHNKIHIEEALTCPICKRKFTNKHSVPVHVRRVHGGLKEVQCEICGKLLTKNAYKNHLRIHTGEKPFNCEECGASFTQRAHLKAHEKFHKGIKDFQCDICGRAFAAKQTLTIHRRTHTGEKPYACYHCPKTFVHTTSLRLHMMQHSPDCYHPCSLCRKVFSKSTSLNDHYKQHSEEALSTLDPESLKAFIERKSNSCQICEMTFPTKHLLHVHYSCHSEEELNKLDTRIMSFVEKLKLTGPSCKICGKVFQQVSALQIHMRRHTGEKPFVCDLCGKAFRMKMMLLNHRRIHTGERPFKCKLCDKSFMQRAHVRSHILTHTGEKPHACTICGKTFAHNGNRIVHEKTHFKHWESNSLDKATYKCSVCNKNCTSKRKCKNHMNSSFHSKEEVVVFDYLSGESYHSDSYISGEDTVVHFSERESIKIENTFGEESIENPAVSVVTPANPSSLSQVIISIGKADPVKEELIMHVIEETDTHITLIPQ